MVQCRLTDFTVIITKHVHDYSLVLHGEVLVLLWRGGGTGVERVVGVGGGGGIMKG